MIPMKFLICSKPISNKMDRNVFFDKYTLFRNTLHLTKHCMEQKGNMIIADYYSHRWVGRTVKFVKSTLKQIFFFLLVHASEFQLELKKELDLLYRGIVKCAALSPLQSLLRNRNSGMMTEDVWKGLSYCSHSMI